MDPEAFERDPVLCGADPQEGIVALEQDGPSKIRIFLRNESALEQRELAFQGFILLEDKDLLKGLARTFEVEPLEGKNEYRWIIKSGNWQDLTKTADHLKKVSGEPPSSPRAPYLFINDPIHQFLILTGMTFFKGMGFSDLHRLSLDIETACAPGYDFSNPERPEDRILSIALADNRGYREVIFEDDERDMLHALSVCISRLDPDVIEGHNIFNFDLDYIIKRAKALRMTIGWGRDGSGPRTRPSRFTVAERIIDYVRVDVFGRQVIDTMFLLQHYDVGARELESYGLKAAARHFGLSEEDRVYIDPGDIDRQYREDPEQLKRYNLQDALETLALSELLGYSFFLQAKIFPFTYQNIMVRGNATKINALFLREYLRNMASVPKPSPGVDLEGGYTDIFLEGLVRDVVHCDVASLYPSVMLSFGLKPSKDSMDVFLPLLKTLKAFRMEAKQKAQQTTERHRRDYFQALQQTFKVLINSFYGYLGTDIHNFSDPLAASEVTRRGREIIHHMVDWLRSRGAIPVEIDTDGIYFVPPQALKGEDSVHALMSELSGTLPAGVEVQADGFYKAMYSYKKKNYALLDKDGSIVIKGSALRSKGMEKYLRDFLSDMLRMILEGRDSELEALLSQYLERIERHQIPIQDLAKRETLRESPRGYQEKIRGGKRNPSALYELALASGREYRAGDQISYYVTGSSKNVTIYSNCKPVSSYDPDRPDENTAYYKDKLISLYRRFAPGKGISKDYTA
jgi:DNA polymerase elongation subunit (family B)